MAPRRSLRSSAASTPAKRARSPPASPISDPRPAKRTKTSPTKSKYFHTEESLARVEDEPDSEDAGHSPSPDGEGSGYEDEDASASEPSEEDAGGDDESEASERPKKRQKRVATARGKGKNSTAALVKSAKGQELWRTNVKTGLGPGTQVVIDKPKARPEGKVRYKDDTIHPNTMLFLKELAENNDREWLKMNDPDYRQALKDSNSFFEELQKKIIEVDETIPELPLKDIIFRIYRDIRFSPDPTPYKAHFSAAWSRTGRKGPFAAYYVQIKPGGKSFVGGGLWMPEARALHALRQDIDKRPRNITDVLLSEGLKKHFFKDSGKKFDGKAAIKAFAEQNAENALKTKPKGYEADHKHIQLLRLRNFTVGTKLEDAELVGPAGINRVAELIFCLVPFITYLNSIVMPDDPLVYEDDEVSDEGDAEVAADSGTGDEQDSDD